MVDKDQETGHKIKEAARLIFQKKGFAGAKTRDIAEAAGINLALLNYYFRSKKKLFDLIMIETLRQFFGGVVTILDDEKTSISQKITVFVERYIDLLSANPNVATFILNSVREDPEDFVEKIGFLEKAKGTIFMNQFMEEMSSGKIPPVNPIHLMLNLLGMVVFPFIAAPMIEAVTKMSHEDYLEVLQERKRLIPLWVEAMLTVK